MLDKINEYMKGFGFTVIDGNDEYLSFESKIKDEKQGKALVETIKKQFGKENLIVDLFAYADKIIIEIQIKGIYK